MFPTSLHDAIALISYRMLGGVSFGIGEMNQPRVTARIFPEKDGALRAALEVPTCLDRN